MEMPGPTEEHAKLEKLAGSWKGEEKVHPTPWDEDGGSATGIVRNQLALGGLVVIQDYTQHRDGETMFEGHGVFAYNAVEECHVLHWFDSMSGTPSLFGGKFEADVLTLTSQHEQGHSRATFDFSTSGQYSFRMDVSQDGENWTPFMEGLYQREN